MKMKMKGFVGIQLDGPSLDDRDEVAFLDELKDKTDLNAVMLLHMDRFRYSDTHSAGTIFKQPQEGIDDKGRDLFDRMAEAAEEREIALVLGASEHRWGYHPAYPGYTTIAQVDCYGQKIRTSCVNNPTWLNFQLACMEDAVREHPYLAGIMFMHERVGPMSAVLFPSAWQGGRAPWCFCEHCQTKGDRRGIDVDRAKMGYQALLDLFEEDGPEPRDGYFITFWRILNKYPEIFAWEQLQWDSLQDFRAAISGAARVVDSEMKVGFHFQHATMHGQPIWRAMEDPERVAQYADWVKPSVYPGASGGRYRNALSTLQKSLLRDLPEDVAHRFIAGIFLRDAEIGMDMIQNKDKQQDYFPAEWVRTEVARLVEAVDPKPLFAGLGIGIPGGEKTETPELVAEWTEACYEGGAKGILLSRHYSEMRPELLAAAGEVIKRCSPEVE
ncbi:MAG: hypothetical protein ACLFQ6_02600 [Candidatus Sumerlaeia bacterium]